MVHKKVAWQKQKGFASVFLQFFAEGKTVKLGVLTVFCTKFGKPLSQTHPPSQPCVISLCVLMPSGLLQEMKMKMFNCCKFQLHSNQSWKYLRMCHKSSWLLSVRSSCFCSCPLEVRLGFTSPEKYHCFCISDIFVDWGARAVTKGTTADIKLLLFLVQNQRKSTMTQYVSSDQHGCGIHLLENGAQSWIWFIQSATWDIPTMGLVPNSLH